MPYEQSSKTVTKWFVYILRCSDGTYYTGSTKNLEARLKTHQEGNGSKYIRSRLPVCLIFSVSCSTKSRSLKLEVAIKKLRRGEKDKLLQSRPTTEELVWEFIYRGDK